MHRTDKYSQHTSLVWPVWLNNWVFVYRLSSCWFEFRCSHLTFRYRTCSNQGVLDIQATIECRFTLKCIRDMIVTYTQMHCTDKYSQITTQLNHLASLVKWLNVSLRTSWLCGLKSRCSQQLHINCKRKKCRWLSKYVKKTITWLFYYPLQDLLNVHQQLPQDLWKVHSHLL